jgi:uncharacterized membrane protein
MEHPYVLLFAFLIGVVSGLRALSALAVTCWAVFLHWLYPVGSPLKYLGSIFAVVLFSVFALFELVSDKLPKTAARTKPAGLIPRILLGGLCGATVAAAGGQWLALGAVLGAVGGIAGAFGGYQVRTLLVKALGVPDFVIAVLEDAVAIGGGLFLLSRF